MERLDGRVAVVTGAASGIGRGLAERFAAEGMRVVLADVDDDGLEQAVAAIRASGASAIGQRTDVSRPAEVETLAERAMQEYGAVHVIVNNAGVESGAAFTEIPLATWRWVMDVNFWGVLHGCRTFLPLLRRADEGHIVNTASLAAFANALPTMTPYAASKWAVLALSENLEIELRRSGEPIGVSLLAPGPVNTQMPYAERNRPPDVPSTIENPERRALLERLVRVTQEEALQPAEVASMVVDAIRERRFFVLTHPEAALAAVRHRLRWMESGEPPPARSADRMA